MNLKIRPVYLCAILVACSACAHNAGGSKDTHSVQAGAASETCNTNSGNREYRNQFLRARRIGQQVCGG